MDSLRSTITGWTFGGVGVLLVFLFLLLPACSDDPILGPRDPDSTSTGGSYSSIKRLAPADSATPADSTGLGLKAPNPERF